MNIAATVFNEKLDEINRLRADLESYIKIGSELATDNERLRAINAELGAALEEVKQFLKPALPYPERDRLFALVGAAIARAKP